MDTEKTIDTFSKLITAIILGFIGAFFCMQGWNVIAPSFNLPVFTYIEWFWIYSFVRFLVK